MVFDIETVGVEFESLDEKSKEFLLKYAQDDAAREEVKEGTSFSPLTGQDSSTGVIRGTSWRMPPAWQE